MQKYEKKRFYTEGGLKIEIFKNAAKSSQFW